MIQLHRDEVFPEVGVEASQLELIAEFLQLKSFLETNGLRYPLIVLADHKGGLEQVLSSSDLTACKGDPKAMVAKLRDIGLLQAQPSL